jgi:hypothetical protein
MLIEQFTDLILALAIFDRQILELRLVSIRYSENGEQIFKTLCFRRTLPIIRVYTTQPKGMTGDAECFHSIRYILVTDNELHLQLGCASVGGSVARKCLVSPMSVLSILCQNGDYYNIVFNNNITHFYCSY